MQTNTLYHRAFVSTLVASALTLGLAAQSAPSDDAKKILEVSGVKGGLIVHLGSEDGQLTTALRANDSYLVQGLEKDAAKVEAARKSIQAQGLYGPVSVENWAGTQLPYIENAVNLVVAAELGAVSMDEVMRVLAPNGVVCVQRGGQWIKTVKPRPGGMDEWTHYLHDSSNNAVAHDNEIQPLTRLQWIDKPDYSRHHDHMSDASAMVTANGRVFYIFEEASRASILIPPQWWIYGRDAFNGKLLWKRAITDWHEHLWPLKSGPQILARRLVAVGDRVYVTLGIDTPLTALDAATGLTLHTYDGTKATEEILLNNGVLYLSVAAQGQTLRSHAGKPYEGLAAIKAAVTNPLWTDASRTIMAVQADSGKTLWKHKTTVVSMSLASDGRRVVFHDGAKLQCLDAPDGRPLWSSAPLARKEGMRSSGGATVVLYGDVVLYSGQVSDTRSKQEGTVMFGVSAKDGKTLWQAEHPPCGHSGTSDDILVLNGVAWSGAVAQGSDSGIMTGRDPLTGKVLKEFPPDVSTHWFHHRCYRAKATDNYLLFSRTGIEFIDVEKSHWTCHHWVRGACLLGIMPANGMIYNLPHPCACYLEAKLYGVHALAPNPKTPITNTPDEARLTRGPAYGAAVAASPAGAEDWPTYRGNAARSGSTKTLVPTDLKQAWSASLGGKLSAVTVAGGSLFVASQENHAVHCLDAATGQARWTFTAGSRVDSPPTIWQGRAIFGSRDGQVYCVRASDGALIWKYQAAPADLRQVTYEQVESVWPVHGSVLVQNSTVYSVAGRSMFLDGGLRMLRLDPETGSKVGETILDDRDPESKANLQVKIKTLNMPVALPDILSCDGRNVYMRSLPFDLQGQRKFVEYVPVNDQKGDDIHLFSPTSFLDDSQWHRSYWLFGRAWASGAGGYYQAGQKAPGARIMVFDDDTVWGYGRRWSYFRWSTPYVNHLFATSKQPDLLKMSNPPPVQKKADGRPKGNLTGIPVTRVAYEWSDELPVQVRAMVLAGKTLFVAGPPELVNEEAAVKDVTNPKVRSALAEQGAAYDGKKGAILTAVSAADGKGLVSYRLSSMPNFDGMAAAAGKLYLSTSDGKVICLGAGTGTALPRAAGVSVTPRTNADQPLSSTPVTTPAKGGKKGKAKA